MIRVCDIIHVTRTIDPAPTAPTTAAIPKRDLTDAIIADFRATMTQLKCASSERLLREGVSMAQVHIMYTVQRHGEMTMSQLADVLNVSDSNATGLVDRMEERGFVVRDRVPEDRRVVVVKVTDAGERLLGEVDALSDEILRSVLDRLDPAQLRRRRPGRRRPPRGRRCDRRSRRASPRDLHDRSTIAVQPARCGPRQPPQGRD